MSEKIICHVCAKDMTDWSDDKIYNCFCEDKNYCQSCFFKICKCINDASNTWVCSNCQKRGKKSLIAETLSLIALGSSLAQNPRKIATEMAQQIVYRAMLLRKGAINVARKAYDRKDRII